MRPCTHWTPVAGYCGNTPTRRYLRGRRCPHHTPARLAGRPEPGATAYPNVKPLPPAPMGASRLIDDRAIASGKRRSSPARYAEARNRIDGGR